MISRYLYLMISQNSLFQRSTRSSLYYKKEKSSIRRWSRRAITGFWKNKIQTLWTYQYEIFTNSAGLLLVFVVSSSRASGPYLESSFSLHAFQWLTPSPYLHFLPAYFSVGIFPVLPLLTGVDSMLVLCLPLLHAKLGSTHRASLWFRFYWMYFVTNWADLLF